MGIPSGDLLFFALGTGEYSELACEWCGCGRHGGLAHSSAPPLAAASTAAAPHAPVCRHRLAPLPTHLPPRPTPLLLPPVVAEVLRAIIAAYRELFKAASLTDGVLLSNYALAVLVVDEVCKEVGGRAGGRVGGHVLADCQQSVGGRPGSGGWALVGAWSGAACSTCCAASLRCASPQPAAGAAPDRVCRAW